MFLTGKRDRTIKARGCADGQFQREYTDKKQALPSQSVTLFYDHVMHN